MRKILLVVNFKSKEDPFNVGGVEYHRLLIPYINLTKNYPAELHQINEIDPENTPLKDFDLVVFSRVLSNYGQDEAILKALQKAGIPFIVDIDDHWRLPTTHLLYAPWQQHRMVQRIETALTNATAVTTTTPHLAGLVRKLNKNTVVCPNAIDPEQPQFIPASSPSAPGRTSRRSSSSTTATRERGGTATRSSSRRPTTSRPAPMAVRRQR